MTSVGRNMQEKLLLHKEWLLINIPHTECNSGTMQKLPFAVDTMIGLKNVTIISDSTGTLVS